MSAATMVCSVCKKETSTANVFCTHCGSKLDFSDIRVGAFTEKPNVVGHLVAKGLRVGVAVLLVLALGLLLWPAPVKGARGGRSQAEQARTKLVALNSALMNGGHRAVEFDEREINGYLAGAVASSQDRSGSFLTLKLDEINVHLAGGAVMVLVSGRWGPLPLTQELTGILTFEDGAFAFDVNRARVGHLVVTGPFKQQVTRRISNMLSSLEKERAVLEKASRYAQADGRVRVAVGVPGESASGPVQGVLPKATTEE